MARLVLFGAMVAIKVDAAGLPQEYTLEIVFSNGHCGGSFMMRRLLQFVPMGVLALVGIVVLARPANANTTALADWCVNLNGDINTACNGAGSGGASGTGSISLASFDTTLEPTVNGLGSVVVTLGQGNGQYAAFYADYDLDFATEGSFQDYATIHGVRPSGVTFEADDPNISNIFTGFAGNTLSNVNKVGTAAAPPSPCCDVSFALAVGGINVGAGDTDTITFLVSTTAPSSGFYIQQTNFDKGDSIYLSYTDSGCQGPNCGVSTVTPEPSYTAILLVGLAALIFVARRKSATAA
jgi:hypothetical protein